MKHNKELNDDANDNKVICKKGSKLGILVLIIGGILTSLFALLTINFFRENLIKEGIFSVIMALAFIGVMYKGVDIFKQIEIVDNKILYKSLFSKKEINITDSIAVKYDLPRNGKNEGRIRIYDEEKMWCNVESLSERKVKEFINVAKEYIFNISSNNDNAIINLNQKEIQSILSWIDKCEEKIQPKNIKTSKNDINVEDSKLGKITFESDTDDEFVYIKCENFKFGKYTPEIIMPGEFDKEEIQLYIKTLNKIYEMRKDIIVALLRKALNECDNCGETDADGNKITIEYVKTNLSIESIYVLSHISIDANGTSSETVFFEINAYIINNREDDYNDYLLGEHTIKASVSNKRNYEIMCYLEG